MAESQENPLPPTGEVIVDPLVPDDLAPPEAAGNEDPDDEKEEKNAETKPPNKLLAEVRQKNEQGLLQNYLLLVPGTRIYTKWSKRFKNKYVKEHLLTHHGLKLF